MIREELVFVATCDISGLVRGKGFPARELPARLKKGVGWTGSNLMMSPFGPIWDTPFGTAGDLMIVPDPAAEVRVDFADGSAIEHFFLGDICNTDGSAWECCPRDFLRRAVKRTGRGGGPSPRRGVRAGIPLYRHFRASGRRLRARRLPPPGQLSARPSSPRCAPPGWFRTPFSPSTAPRQFEVTVMPQPALTAADHAVITREMARAAAHRLGHRVIFSPKPDPDLVGNGVHIHMSLVDAAGRPATHAPGEPMELSKPAQHFFAGVLHHMPAICAITAPSPVSYLRLTPNAWAPTVIDLVRQDRGASLRICPVFAAATPAEMARQFHVEFRATDAAASPYLALGAVIFAGVDGIRRELPLPAPARRRRCPARFPRRSTGSPPARRWPAGSARPISTPICGSSASRRKKWRGCRPPSSAPATPRFIDGRHHSGTRGPAAEASILTSGAQLLEPDEPTR